MQEEFSELDVSGRGDYTDALALRDAALWAKNALLGMADEAARKTPNAEAALREFVTAAAPFVWLESLDAAIASRSGLSLGTAHALTAMTEMQNAEVLRAYRGIRDRRRGTDIFPLDKALRFRAEKVAVRFVSKDRGTRASLVTASGTTQIAAANGNVSSVFKAGEFYLLEYKSEKVLVLVEAVTTTYIEVTFAVMVEIVRVEERSSPTETGARMPGGQATLLSWTEMVLMSQGATRKAPYQSRGRLYIDVAFNSYGPEVDFVENRALQVLPAARLEDPVARESAILDQLFSLRSARETSGDFNAYNWGTLYAVWHLTHPEPPTRDDVHHAAQPTLEFAPAF